MTPMNLSEERRPHLAARLELVATILLIVVALLVGGVTLWDRLNPQPTRAAAREPPLPKEPVPIEGAPILGNRSAKVALILFSDFECPFCAKSALEVLPEIDRVYLRPGKAFLVWRHYPLEIHKNAQKAAEAAECAARQGRFWKFHDWAFQNTKNLDQANLRAAATALELDPAVFGTCLEGQAVATVQTDLALGNAVSIVGTPAWLVGTVQPGGKVRVTDRLTGARSFTELQNLLDKAVASAERSERIIERAVPSVAQNHRR